MANCFLYLGGVLKIPEYDQHSTKAQRRDNACVLNMTSQIIRIARDDKKVPDVSRKTLKSGFKHYCMLLSCIHIIEVVLSDWYNAEA